MNRSIVAMLLILRGAVGCGANGGPAVRDAGSDEPTADAGSDAVSADAASDEPSADAGSDGPSLDAGADGPSLDAGADGPAPGPDAGPDRPSPDAGQPDGGIARDQFLAAYKHARCSYLARCGFMRSLEACLASTTFNSFSGFRYLFAAVDRGVVTYDPSAAEACVAALAVQACIDTTPAQPLCSQIFHGTLPPGGTCLSGEECAPAATGTAMCVGQSSSCGSGCCPGICSSVETAPAGGSCAPGANGAFLRCPQGQYCHLQMRTCVPVAGLGAACDRVGSPQACQPGLFCGRDAMSGATKCFQPAPTGGLCNPVNFPTSGALSCTSVHDFCKPGPTLAMSTCVPRVPVGGSCASGVPCTWTAYCDFSQVCRALIGLGEDCPAGEAGVCEGELGCVQASDGTATCVLPPDAAFCPPPT